jgi:hypothetical protein
LKFELKMKNNYIGGSHFQKRSNIYSFLHGYINEDPLEF